MKRALFVTGTDTGVGKTLVSAMLVTALRRAGLPAGYWKPLETGDESDPGEIARLVPGEGIRIAEPAGSFALPAAPLRAAQAEGRRIELSEVVARWNELPGGWWVVEGAGGILVPLTGRETTRDLVRALRMPALVVASTRLGTINHTLLTIEALRIGGIPVAGLVLSGPDDPGLASLLESFGKTAVVSEIPTLDDVTPEVVDRLAAREFAPARLETHFAEFA